MNFNYPGGSGHIGGYVIFTLNYCIDFQNQNKEVEVHYCKVDQVQHQRDQQAQVLHCNKKVILTLSDHYQMVLKVINSYLV
jgi:hypothetical protein